MTPASLPLLFGRAVRRIHAIGVAGMGLGPLAVYLARRGWIVTGEDGSLTPGMGTQLQRAGVKVTEASGLPGGTDLVVFSSAVPPEHPTRVAARAAGVPMVRRGELLAEVARERRLVGICGSHGKTTVTAMIIHALRASGWNPGYVLGGLMTHERVPPAQVGEGEWLVAELDESDGTIAGFTPAITVVVNVDWDHSDHYPTAAALEVVISDLISRTTEWVLGSDQCATSTRLMAKAGGAAQRGLVGRSGEFEVKAVTATGGGQRLVLGGGFRLKEAEVNARGGFNALNAALALAAIERMGAEVTATALTTFAGVRRRQMVLWQRTGLTVLEDYAHHPAEIRALLGSLRADLATDARLVVVFQPHRFSRTRQFKAEFAAALAAADTLHLLDVYGAGEAPLSGGTTADLYAELVRLAPRLPVNYVPGDAAGVLELLSQSRRPGDCVVFVGAGDIEGWARTWLTRIEREDDAASRWDAVAADLRTVMGPGAKVTREEVLATKTTLRLGGPARVYVEPADTDQLQALVRYAASNQVPVRLLGRGSNLLVPDAGVDAIVVTLRGEHWERFLVEPDGRVRVGAGLRLKALCGQATKAGLPGFEFLEGIPGNVGGALRMNAGAMGGWMFDVVEGVELLTFAGERLELKRDQLHVDYRHCRELEDAIALGAWLRAAEPGAASEISRQIDVYRTKRQESQPREPSAGCIFKNPPNDSAGRLIDACGLKGERIGDAEVSTVHGNFIINRGQATSAEVIELVRRVRAEVQRQTGIELQPEVLLYGRRWEDVL